MLIYLQTTGSAEDRSRFEQLYLKYRSLMLRVAMRILHNEQDAEDAVHQAFLSILNNLEKISDVDCLQTRSYIVIIVERKSIDLIRERKKAVGLDDEAETGIEISMPGDNPLAEAMAKLPPRYREALQLRFFVGYGIKEVGEVLGIEYGAAQRLILRAKDALEKRLKEEAT